MLTRSVILAALAVLVPATLAAAHTETDLVAVPTGEQVTIRLRPTHGCSGSPTTEVAIQAPVDGATAGPVEGWTTTATADGRGHTVLRWTGGSLPADQTGEFPVTFVVTGTPGQLLTLPAVQRCANGQELAWISGDPAAEYPAPRVLILAAGSSPAATIEEVPADAPGRNLITEVVDVDNAAVTTTTLPPATTAAAPVTSTSTAERADAAAAEEPDGAADDGFPVVLVVAIAAAVAVGAGVWWSRTRRD